MGKCSDNNVNKFIYVDRVRTVRVQRDCYLFAASFRVVVIVRRVARQLSSEGSDARPVVGDKSGAVTTACIVKATIDAAAQSTSAR